MRRLDLKGIYQFFLNQLITDALLRADKANFRFLQGSIDEKITEISAKKVKTLIKIPFLFCWRGTIGCLNLDF